MDETIFDKIIDGSIPADIVYQDDYVVAFKDINPQAPVHVLVIPKKKVAGFSSLKAESALDVGEYLTRVSQVAEKIGLDNDGYRVVFNQGRHGQQTVEYIHAHILGGRQMTWPPG